MCVMCYAEILLRSVPRRRFSSFESSVQYYELRILFVEEIRNIRSSEFTQATCDMRSETSKTVFELAGTSVEERVQNVNVK